MSKDRTGVAMVDCPLCKRHQRMATWCMLCQKRRKVPLSLAVEYGLLGFNDHPPDAFSHDALLSYGFDDLRKRHGRE